jgi:acetolactate decarboxylase
VTDIDQMEKALDISFPENNVPMAFKLHGLFSYIQTRSVRAQKKPYPLLVDATKNLPACERRGIAGTIIGFRFPSYFQGIAMAGYTFDFISDDRTFGGHLLNAAADHLNVVVSDTPAFFLSLPVNKPFNQLNLLGSSTTQITVPPK